MDFHDKKVCIIGYGKSGRAAAERLLAAGATVKVSENMVGTIHELSLQSDKIQFESGGHTADFCCDADMIVVSPGVHLDIPAIEEARKKDIPVISEIELAFLFFSKPIIAVTGTNGKTTTAILIGEMLKSARLRTVVAGNIGLPLVSIDDSSLDYVVAEVSSYQLETIDRFRPHIAVLLNLTPDHMDRYKTMEAYTEAKKRIFMNQTPDDVCIFNQDDGLVREAVSDVVSKRAPFSRKQALDSGLFINQGFAVRLNENVADAVFSTDEVRIKGGHNLENALAAASAALCCGVPYADIAGTLREFPGVEHRIEFVRSVNGVDFFNDSKATNPDSTVVALKAISRGGNVILILGGRDKGTSLKDMCDTVKYSAKSVVLIGEASDRFEWELKERGVSQVHRSASLEDAVKLSLSMSSSGDSVLLSPACASFDMFKDFEDRGKAFKGIVNGL
jgi:UDP-N-acetylmuramoylalanine--D-glutamate ligase